MNLGIEGRTAIVCASSQGLGLAFAQALAQEGVNVVLNGRDQAKLDSTAAALREIARGEIAVAPQAIYLVSAHARAMAIVAMLVAFQGGVLPGDDAAGGRRLGR